MVRGVTLTSWVPGADGSGFGLENLPFGVVKREPARTHPAWPAVRIGNFALGLRDLIETGLLDLPPSAFEQPNLNGFLKLGEEAWSGTRDRLIALLGADSPDAALVRPLLVELERLRPVLPVETGDYVDFYASLEHATNLGRLFRPESEPLLSNWRQLPVAYHGRAGSVIVSDTPVRRPLGQQTPADPGGIARFGPEPWLDFELELGFVTGDGPPDGQPISIHDAERHIFGFVLVNDWSARAIQRWEYQPLGPFLGKSFATSLSPWIVPRQALMPARVTPREQQPRPLPYLRAANDWALDISLEVSLIPAGGDESHIVRTNSRGLYWTPIQQLAHATINGAAVRAGDLFASGTISGDEADSYGSLIELTQGGRRALTLRDGTERTFLQDGDTVVMRGRAGSVSLGEVRGRVEPNRPTTSG
jgi:fumarylacetoacetase